MTIIRVLCLCFISIISFTNVCAEGWADSGDSVSVEDIDAGAQREETTNDDLIRDANGPGQSDNPAPPGNTPVYDGYGYPFAFGVPYGFSPLMGYGSVAGANGAATRQ